MIKPQITMAREEALKKAINIVRYFEAHFSKSKKALSSSKPQPCEDAINRTDMLDAIGHGTTYTSEDLQRIIKSLPPADPQMIEQWKELKETIIEMRDGDGTGTQQEACKFLANLMDVLEKQIQEPKTGMEHWIPVSEELPKTEQYAFITVHNQTKMCWYQNGVFVDGEQNAYTKENEELVAWMPFQIPKPYKTEISINLAREGKSEIEQGYKESECAVVNGNGEEV